MRSVRVALTAGFALMALAIVVVLSRSPLIVAGTNSVPVEGELGTVTGGAKGCQQSGTLPGGTSAIRLSLASILGPRLTVRVLSGSRLITQGERAAGWGIAESVTVPVKRVARTTPNTRICVGVGAIVVPLTVFGGVVRTTAANGRTIKARHFRIEYLRAGHRSWWSLASSVARRMGLGHAPGGTWIVFFQIALMIAITVLASRLILRSTISRRPSARAPAQASSQRTRMSPVARGTPASWAQAARGHAARVGVVLRRVPRAAWVCALIACLNAACWSLITPPFQATDEPSHFAYVQHLAETRTLPVQGKPGFAEEEEVALRALKLHKVRWHPEVHPVATGAEQRSLQHDLAQPLSRTGEGAEVAAPQPPLYYALQTIPYWLGSGGTLLDRLELMRLLSAIMAGVTALFAYLFVREALPGAPWAWAVGGLGVALAPLLGFMSGTVNPDTMLYAVSAAIFYLLARGFRRGLTPRLAAAIGVLAAIGFLTKNNFVGLAPGVLLGLVVLALRGARRCRRTAYRSLALAVAIAASPVCVYLVVNLLSNHPGLGLTSSTIDLTSKRGSIFHEISYIWQFYLPRLPGMANDFPGIFTTRQIWFDRSVGLYGWLDTPFPVWVYNIALIPTALLTILGIRALIVGRAELRRRLVELVVYAVMGSGLLALAGAASYLSFPEEAGRYGEPRYLLPLLALLGAMLALSARGAGRRWGPAAGTLIVVLFLAHNVFSQLQVIARFYG
jgi:hypothetical protein